MDIRDIALTAVVAALYASLVVFLAPISYGPVQLRVADCLIPLSAILGWPAIAGVTVGCLVGNAYYWLSPLDVALGPLANLASSLIVFALRRRPLLACVVGSLPIGLVVGGYLWMFFPPPGALGAVMPAWLGMVVSITLSSLIAVGGLGYGILKALLRPNVVAALRSSGIRVYVEEDQG